MYTFRGSLAPSPTVRRIRSWATAVSLYLEAFLCHLHTLLYFFFLHTYEPASRAWWDSSKGSAVVIYAPHNDAVARYVALRLSSGSPSSFALKDVGPTKRNPRAPYTCFVLHADSDQFSITVAQWAAKKARIEKALLKQKAGRSSESSSSPSSPTSTTHTFDAESSADRSEPSSPSPTPSAQLGPRGDETPRASRKSRPPPIQINRRRRRSRSWSAWATPDLFGYGIDMLKGWMPGRSGPKATPAGTIIPIMADVQTADGLAMINSTISAYCNSHDLLLSGVILVPSVLCPRNVPLTKAARADMPKTPGSAYSDVDPFSLCNRDVWGEVRASASGSTGRLGAGLTGPRDPFGLAPAWREASDLGASMDSSSFNAASPPLSPTSARIVRTQDDHQAALHSALATDVVQAKALINVLFPALKRDKGRILGLVPSGYGPELPHDPDTLSLQSLPSRNGSGKARDRSHSGSSSSADLMPERDTMPVLKTWPGAVVNTVREALRTQYREMELEYKRRGGSAKHVHVSTIETNALVRLPQTRLKKMVKWNESVRFFNTRKRMAWRWRDLLQPARLLDRLPFIARFGRLRGEDSHASPPDGARYGIYIPAELRPFLRGWVRPLSEARDEDDIYSTAPALVRLVRRLVRVLRWIEQCCIPWDDLAEHVAAVSYPIALGSSCPPTPGPSQSLLHPYTVSSNHAPSAHRQLWSGTSKKVDDDEDAADFPFSTASSGPAVTLLNVKAEPVRVPRTYPRELSHQNPTPLFESIRSALTSYHPRRTYYPTLAGCMAAVIHDAAPWVHEWIKPALAAYLLQYTVESQP